MGSERESSVRRPRVGRAAWELAAEVLLGALIAAGAILVIWITLSKL